MACACHMEIVEYCASRFISISSLANLKSSQTMKTQHYLFGYGSLINQKSRQRTIPRSISAIPARVSGFVRSWSYRCPKRQYTAVSVTRLSNLNELVNGVLVPLEIEDLKILDSREKNYARGIVPASQIYTEFNLPANAVVWIYENHTQLAVNHSTSSLDFNEKETHSPSPSCPIPQSYLDCIMVGCLNIGQEFAQEFIKLTKGWCEKSYLLDRNDAEHQKCVDGAFSISHLHMVDSLLAGVVSPNKSNSIRAD